MQLFFKYLLDLCHETFALGVFLLGLISTIIFYIPSLPSWLGVPERGAEYISRIGIITVVLSFIIANYRIYARLRHEIEKIKNNAKENDVESIYQTVLEIWRKQKPGTQDLVSGEAVLQRLGWEQHRLLASAYQVSENPRGIHMIFDGRSFEVKTVTKHKH